MWPVAIAGLVLGLVSSFHCVGMCGPLSLALPTQHLSRPARSMAILLYNIGRVVTYSLFGLLFGLAGRKLYIAGIQQWISIALGTLMLVMATLYYYFKKDVQPSWMKGFHHLLAQVMMRVLQSKTIGAYLLLGMVNGLLPCGMVYFAIAGALAQSELINAVVFMAGFGLGTMPLMMAFSLVGMKISMDVRRHMKRAVPYLMGVIAVLMIFRGLNLGIPFISPHITPQLSPAIDCH